MQNKSIYRYWTFSFRVKDTMSQYFLVNNNHSIRGFKESDADVVSLAFTDHNLSSN